MHIHIHTHILWQERFLNEIAQLPNLKDQIADISDYHGIDHDALRKLFRHYDADRDGHIDLEQFKAAMIENGYAEDARCSDDMMLPCLLIPPAPVWHARDLDDEMAWVEQLFNQTSDDKGMLGYRDFEGAIRRLMLDALWAKFRATSSGDVGDVAPALPGSLPGSAPGVRRQCHIPLMCCKYSRTEHQIEIVQKEEPNIRP